VTSARVQGSAAIATQATAEQRRRFSWPIAGALIALVALSTVAHLWALHRDLPLQEPDESAFVRPAVRIAATRDLNPEWFGHPGSTVIYPVAGLIRGWETLAHDGPLIGAAPELTERFQKDPTTYYVIGRLWTIALSVGAIPLLFLVGRRAFNTRVALIASAIWVVLPDPVHFGRIVRTDSAAVFFGLLALWLCLRALDDPRIGWCVLAGLSVGLAVASRYFMLALIPCLVAAAVLPRRHDLRSAARAVGVASGCAVGGFVLSTPYFFLDWSTAWSNLQNENEPLLGRGGYTPLGNLRWYVGTAIPASLTWPLLALAVVGIILVFRRRRPPQLLLLAFCATFLVGICASKIHWQRWVIEILPILILLAGLTVDTVVQRLTAASRVSRGSLLRPVGLVAVTAVLAILPATELAAMNRRDSRPSTSGAALTWIESHVEPGSQLLVDPATLITRDHTRLDVDDRFSPRTDTLAEYRAARYDYLVINGLKAGRYSAQRDRYPHETAFYVEIGCSTRLAAVFPTTTTRRGAAVRIYRLDEPASPEVAIFCAPQGGSQA
jgi:4-amino-4-deoxy-L-arabinose transferase-like glycosyltransferase